MNSSASAKDIALTYEATLLAESWPVGPNCSLDRARITSAIETLSDLLRRGLHIGIVRVLVRRWNNRWPLPLDNVDQLLDDAVVRSHFVDRSADPSFGQAGQVHDCG